MTALRIDLVRVHDVLDDDGSDPAEHRVLVDRLWPRGIRKERLQHDEWAKEVAPSTDLRKAFHGGELDVEEFAEHYRRELERSGAAQTLRESALDAGATRLVLLFAAKDIEHNHAQVLRDVVAEAGR